MRRKKSGVHFLSVGMSTGVDAVVGLYGRII